MMVEFSQGKIIVTPHEIVIRLVDTGVTVQSQNDAVQLILGANVISANGSECKWSVRVDSEKQLNDIATAMGIDTIKI
ncbi:DUF3389 domain-containing protein [Vibrio sp. ZSDZ34]|jgi:hypothetical protein|uniref:DUF3389 domain-containing protein n=1 Tax=Vibrio gelatinilyticus TaxID=2893468 RepID=A0A9X1WBE7_9VIBR|nr:DUF3389 family protein [Vibrio gelatinilyticus]MCJ2377134.1 DUF3389 domain-containing protein [Vibrio gelatinilyticus]